MPTRESLDDFLNRLVETTQRPPDEVADENRQHEENLGNTAEGADEATKELKRKALQDLLRD